MALCLVVTGSAAALPAGATTTSNSNGINNAGSISSGGAAGTAAMVAISEIQTPSGDGSGSPYAGETVTTTGTVTAVGPSGFHVQNGTGAYSGLYVYTGGAPEVSVGDAVEVTGLVKEFEGLTEIDATVDSASVTTTGTAPVPEPTTLDTGNVSREAYEGVLVRVEGVQVTATPGEFGEWAINDGTGELTIDDVAPGDSTTPSETGATADAIEGPLYYSFGAFKLQPTAVVNVTSPSDDDGTNGTDVEGPTLTVLSYNDIQTAASNPKAMGRLKGAIDARRAAHDNPTVVVGGGDEVSPSSLSPVSNWTVPIRVLNTIDPAAELIGNHDLDFGFDAVENFSAASSFPWVVANIQQTDADGGNVPGTSNYTIVERDGVKIGILGLVSEEVKFDTAVDFAEKGYTVTDYLNTGKRIATKLKEEKGVDVVVATIHIGVPEAKRLARSSDDIDVIVTGHDEIEYPPETTSGTVIMEAQARAAYLAELNLTVGDNETAMESGRLIDVVENDAIPVDETVERIVNDSRKKFLSKTAGRTTVRLDSTFASNYAEETAWGNLITDGFRAKTGAEVAVTNAGGIRGDFVIEPGPVTYDDVYTSLPFGNYLVTKSMTGEKLYQLLESQVTPLTDRFGGQASLQVSGVSYEFTDRPDADRKLTDVHVDGEPLRMDATYNVTINSFMAGWTFEERYGWNMSDLPTVGTDFTLYGTAVVEYVEANSPVSPEGVDRIRRITRSVGPAGIARSGDTATLTYDVPAAVGRIDPGTFRVENETHAVVNATGATLSDGTLTVTFDADELRRLRAASTNLELYGLYNDTEFDAERNGWDQSKLNGEIYEGGTVLASIAGDDRVVDREELRTAVTLWSTGEPVPGTEGAVVEDDDLQDVITAWALEESVPT
jgi:2',3'-cyclic-nucleotide 2'-phosphodiesterase (5'-nucleotidase family)